MNSMLDQWSKVLSSDEVDLMAEEIADVCWLALIQHRFGVESPGEARRLPASPPSKPQNRLDSDAKPPSDPPPLPPQQSSQSPAPSTGGLFTRDPASAPKTSTKTVRVPTAAALRDPLPLARALRPLLQHWPVGRGTKLDEPATVKKITEEKVWWPITQPQMELWLELALVVDESPSMLIWRRTVEELGRFLKHYGFFRDVRLWGLTAKQSSTQTSIAFDRELHTHHSDRQSPKIYLRPTPFSRLRTQDLRQPDSLLDPTGRRLILIVSDCVDSLWQTPQLLSTLKLWTDSNPLAILQMMPEWLWPRTNLRQATVVNFRGRTKGSMNPALEVVLANASYHRKSRTEKQKDIKVPVITLESDRVSVWAQMLTAQGLHQASGVIFNPRAQQMSVAAQQRRQQKAATTSTAAFKAQSFRGGASPLARRLASLLAASPGITLPIINAVQETLLPHSEQVHVAEVLLGGILQPKQALTLGINPDDVQYEFIDPDVRSELLKEAPVKDTTAVLSRYIEDNFNTSLYNFILELRGLMQSEGATVDELKPVATIAAEVLQYRGAEYAEFVQAVKARYEPSQLPDRDRAPSSTFPELEDFKFTEARLSDTPEPVFPPPPHTKEFTIITLELDDSFEPDELIMGQGSTSEVQLLTFLNTLNPLAVERYRDLPRYYREEASIEGVNYDVAFCQMLVETNELSLDDESLTQKNFGGLGSVTGDTGGATFSTARMGVRAHVQHLKAYASEEPLVQQLVDPRFRLVRRGIAPAVHQLSGSWKPDREYGDRIMGYLKRLYAARSPSNLDPFDFTVATLVRDKRQWTMQPQQQSAYCFIEELTYMVNTGAAIGIPGLDVEDKVSVEMVAIPGGSFLMGSPENEPGRNATRESPQHEVTVPPFFMGRYPVTQAQWRIVAGTMPQVERELSPDPSRFKGEDRPVEQVSWYEAVEFCARLSAHTGRQYRLPTEAEWEYACRAGTTTPFHFGDMITTEVANYNGSAYARGPKGESQGETTPVDHFSVANAVGLSDMHGNVYEWCQDYWHENYEGAPTDGSVWVEGGDSSRRVIRGGSWGAFPRRCRSAYRSWFNPDNVGSFLGFRVVCSAPRSLP